MGTLALLLMLVVLWYVLLRCTRDAEAARSEAASLVFVVVFLWYRTPIKPIDSWPGGCERPRCVS